MTLPRNVLAAVVALVVGLAAFTAAPALGVTAFTVSGTRALHDPPFPEQ
jgi:hypothetical protein